MNLETIQISSVNMEERKELGIRAGDTVRVWVKIEEKGKTRTQAFEGLVLARKHGNEPGATFTVRKVASGVGVERIFPLFSPMIDKIEIIKRARVRRSKLYFIREKVAREIRRQMRKMKMVTLSTKSEGEEVVRIEKEAEQAKIDAEKAEEIVETPIEAEVTSEEVVEAPVEEFETEAEVETKAEEVEKEILAEEKTEEEMTEIKEDTEETNKKKEEEKVEKEETEEK